MLNHLSYTFCFHVSAREHDSLRDIHYSYLFTQISCKFNLFSNLPLKKRKLVWLGPKSYCMVFPFWMDKDNSRNRYIFNELWKFSMKCSSMSVWSLLYGGIHVRSFLWSHAKHTKTKANTKECFKQINLKIWINILTFLLSFDTQVSSKIFQIIQKWS